MRVVTVGVLCIVALAGAGCGSDEDSGQEQREARQAAAREAAERRAREARRVEARERREALRRRARREAARERARAEARERREEEQAEQEERERQEAEPGGSAQASECDPSYEGACLDPNASDYDCEGGSGDGPYYTGPVTVVGPDHYDLDRDGDGYACE